MLFYCFVINAEIAKFTSISWGVTIGPEEHDFNRVTNHSFLYSTKSFQLVKEKIYSPITKECTIGNDVWIGCNSTVLRGVAIGDGAVIGANSLVNKDVPPYAIVVGSPAKIIKYRFSEEIIEALVPDFDFGRNDEIKKDIEELSYDEGKANMKSLKKDIKGGISENQQSTHFTITFRSYDDKAEFLESIGINGDDTIITSDKFLKRLNDN